MGLLSFFKRPSNARSAVAESADDVQRVRTRARQRLIGAMVLIAAGVVGFPLLFESQPRPIPVDIPIEIVRKDQAPPLVMPPARAKAASSPAASRPASKEPVVTEAASDAGRGAEPGASAVAATSSAASTPAKVEAPATAAVATAPAAARAPSAAPELRARIKPDSKAAAEREAKEPNKEPVKKDDVQQASGRFVVQVGSFSDAAAARDMRQRVEKLGLKTHTQVVETSSGSRIRVRVGPFASRDDAEKAAGKIKSAGLSTALFPL